MKRNIICAKLQKIHADRVDLFSLLQTALLKALYSTDIFGYFQCILPEQWEPWMVGVWYLGTGHPKEPREVFSRHLGRRGPRGPHRISVLRGSVNFFENHHFWPKKDGQLWPSKTMRTGLSPVDRPAPRAQHHILRRNTGTCFRTPVPCPAPGQLAWCREHPNYPNEQ